MTSPILKAVATQLVRDGEGSRRSLPKSATEGPLPAPQTLVLSGLLPAELDEVADAFDPAGLSEAERRQEGDWAALLLRRE